MPSIGQHQTQAKHNEDFFGSIDLVSSPFRDWAVTALFYGALHHINCLLHCLGYTDAQIDTHRDTENCLRRHPKLKKERNFRNNYRHLKDDSEDARYRCYRHSETQVRALANTQFADIRRFVKQIVP